MLAGAKDVGKSSLIARFCDNVFNENMLSTIGVAFKRKKIKLKGFGSSLENISFNIWDFGGEEKYRALFPSYVNGAAAALILHDITDRKTLEDIRNWVDIIDNNADNVIKVLIGTKMDLEDQRAVPKEEAQTVSDQFGCLGPVVETSSKTGANVEDAFMHVAEAIVKLKLQKCPSCDEYYDKKLKFCRHCGQEAPVLIIDD